MKENIFLRISRFFRKWAKGWLILLILFFVVFILSTITFPSFSSGNFKLVSLDAFSFYSPNQIFSIIDSWGGLGRVQQLNFHLTWDILIPILGLFLIGFSISWLTQRGFKSENNIQRINLVAFGSIFDLLENFCIIILIIFYPSRLIIPALFKTFFTSMKYLSGIIIFLVFLFVLFKAIKNKFKPIK